jgi:hypothetical protein
VPPLPLGLACRRIAAGVSSVVARVGGASSYVTFAAGCAGSLPATRLVPLDTPRIGATLQVHLDSLSVDVAFVVTGSSNTVSALGPLAGNGLGAVTSDAATGVVGN